MADAYGTPLEDRDREVRIETLSIRFLKLHLEFWKGIAEGLSYEEARGVFALDSLGQMLWEETFPRAHSYLRGNTMEGRRIFAQRRVRMMEEQLHENTCDVLMNLRNIVEAVTE